MVLSFMRSLFVSSESEQHTHVPSQLISLPNGRLDIVRLTHNNKITRECIYLAADVIIRPTSIPFNYQLVASRILAEDEELPDNEHDFEKIFLIDQTIEFSSYPSTDEVDHDGTPSTTFGWTDKSSEKSTDRYEFVIDPNDPLCSDEQVDRFTEILYRCMWERIHSKDSAEAPEEDLEALKIVDRPVSSKSSEPSEASEPPLFRPRVSDSEEESDAEQRTLSGSEFSEQPDPESTHDAESDFDSQEDSSDDEIADQLRAVSLKNPETPHSHRSATLDSPQMVQPSSGRKSAVTPSLNYKGKDRADHLTTEDRSSAASPYSCSTSAPSTSTKPARSPAGVREMESVIAPTSQSTIGSYPSSSSIGNDVIQESPARIQPEAILHDAAHQPTEGDMICTWEDTCDLYLFDQGGAFNFVLRERGVQASLWTPGPHTANKDACWLTVLGPIRESEEPATWVSTNLDKEQSLSFAQGAITFIYTSEPTDGSEKQRYTWCLRFPNDEASRDKYTLAQEAFAAALFDRENGLGSWARTAAESRAWNRQGCGMIVEGDEDVEMAYEEEEEVVDEESDDPSDDVDEDSEDENSEAQKFRGRKNKYSLHYSNGPKNSGLAIGNKEDCSFVLRGNIIGVFKNEANGNKKLQFIGSTSELRTPDGKRLLAPTEMMLHKQDSTMVLHDPLNPTSLYNLDLATGQVVEEWKISDTAAVTNFIPKTKFAQMDPESTFIGTSHNSFYTIDPRLSGFKQVADQTKIYGTAVDFSCAATTEGGHLAVGSNKGDIRLYDSRLGKIAKTHFSHIKDPIRGIDISKDGSYLIATCPTYLVFLKVTYDDDGKASKSFMGFEKSIPVAKREIGLRVELKPEHRAFIISQNVPISFAKATFNSGPDSVEKTVVTSIGPFIIAFNLRKLKMDQIEYTMKTYDEEVVAGQFRWNNDRDIVVTMGSDVFMERRSKLAKPDRYSLLPSRSSGAHYGDVVQEWSGR
ncbi:hypothetical protein CROQUDRAFT_654179 [Cronartium quercuum f. sp. fusiforme G11]|uniref:VID27 cytoplasmic protein-domain-containing protein n=1 Tax=Cronartium quercuum f. sp. fusiforme G11 TaxID=708437 RepID=A0A9P6NRP1_9BASI|nr:hypothetical protein CROQUDRAFT_654179 [Cronartium quercuum f. sp. fusiforme G11]